jgi:glycolate oxidase iron-sulfur subunit
MPRAPRADAELVALLAACGVPGPVGAALDPGPVRGGVVFFRGCANRGFLPDASRRLRELIAGAGYRVVDPPGQDCCGALAAHSGRPGRAAALNAANESVFGPLLAGETVLVVEAAGCGHELKQNARLGPRTRDAVEFLATADLPPLGAVPLRVALHDPCHARHGQGLVEAPRRLLARIPGLEVVEPEEAEVCCGSGGAWGLRYPDMSADLGRRKAGFLAATGADLVVTSNPGCLGQIADGLAFHDAAPPVLPLTDLVWFAARRGRV